MTVSQAEKIDGIGVDPKKNAVVLLISDDLPWNSFHLNVLEAKLAAYIRFIESGQLHEHIPDARGLAIEIQALCMHRPDQSGLEFLEAAREAVSARGLAFSHGPIPGQGYCGDA